ncbi:MAG: YraN family protein [Bacteroidota bacterium]
MKNSLGEFGEQLAVKHLQKNGYLILNTNWRFVHKEIDIVAKKEDTIIFVEVKSRADDFFENPQDSVNMKKQRNLIDAAESYIETYDINLESRFDIIAIIKNNNKYIIEHIEDAFHPFGL